MSTALATLSPAQLERVPVLPWRDPHSVPPEQLRHQIVCLENACLEQPESANLRTCLGMAYAMNYDVYKSMDALEAARALAPDHFWAQMKFAELHYRLRALPRAERETKAALELATNGWEMSVARKQLQEIRGLLSTSTRTMEWSGPLWPSALAVSGLIATLLAAAAWWR